ncbi:MAG: hypothetical protein Q7R54_02125 [bacterium]|nr:hypothetical protein [bacterium]
MLEWLAVEMERRGGQRDLLIFDFSKTFGIPFSIGRLAKLLQKAGDKQAFIKKYRPPQRTLSEWEEEEIIVEALEEWLPKTGFKRYAYAAMEVNKARIAAGIKNTIDAEEVERIVKRPVIKNKK